MPHGSSHVDSAARDEASRGLINVLRGQLPQHALVAGQLVIRGFRLDEADPSVAAVERLQRGHDAAAVADCREHLNAGRAPADQQTQRAPRAVATWER